MQQSLSENKETPPGWWLLYKDLNTNCLRGFYLSVLARRQPVPEGEDSPLTNPQVNGLVWELLFAVMNFIQLIPKILILTAGIPLTTFLFIFTPLVNLLALPLVRHHIKVQIEAAEERRRQALLFSAEQVRRKSKTRKAVKDV